ncbi:MAG: Sec-independent protein translocase subunit TatA [Pseudonocardia sp.]|nr:Sec-independent protein translocase subunit TatA [Pseudonocardia sp.]
MGAMSPTHWLIVLGVLLLLFGAKKLPDLARSVGQSTRVLKGEMRGLKEDEDAAGPAAKASPAVEQPSVVRNEGA